MGEKELFNFGDKELNLNSLINNITQNEQSYLDYYSNSIPDTSAFIENLEYIKQGLKNGSITTDGSGTYYDKKGRLSRSDKTMSNALHYVDTIATAQSKKERTLTQSEITQQKEDAKRKQLELEQQRREQEQAQRNIKPDFNPSEGWSVASAFAHSFNQNGQIPYSILQQLVTTDSDGNHIYTDLYAQLDKNFDLVSKQLQQFNNTESYINSINLFKQALKDGDLSPQDKFLGMELGFQSSELDKLNALIKYKINTQELNDESLTEEVVEQTSTPEVPVLQQDPLESDESFKERVGTAQRTHDWYTEIMNLVNFNDFYPAKKIKSDSEEEFKNYLKNYISNWIVSSSKNSSLTRKHHYYSPSTIGATSSYVTVPLHDITDESLKYLDPKLYNELGLKYFSKHSASKMYKYFKDLVEKQNKEREKERIAQDIAYTKYDPFMNVSVRPFYQEGGIIKANEGVKMPWRLNFNDNQHDINAIYQQFTENAQLYDAKQMAEALNKLNSENYTSLNFQDNDNTLGFKSWNTDFNDSGLNNLFGYDESKSDYLGVTTRSRNDFVNYLKTQGSIATGNGNLSWNSETNQWEYSDPNLVKESPENTDTDDGSQGAVVAPDVADLTLKDVNFKKPRNFNKNGILNSLAGFIVNQVSNKKKHEKQKEIPVYQEQDAPEKSFRTAYTYDLEKAKNEVIAEANSSIQPMTSDISTYYAAKNDSIKNARAYATKLDTEINNRVHQVNEQNADIAFENATRRTETANNRAKYNHDWIVEQLQGDVDLIEATNQSIQNLNKEIKHNLVTEDRENEQRRDAHAYRQLTTGLLTNPSNYINGWTKHHDLIWYKGQNNLLETDQEQIEYQQLMSLVNQASENLLAQYDNVKFPGMGVLHVSSSLNESYDPTKHGKALQAKKGTKIDKQKIGNYINKLK